MDPIRNKIMTASRDELQTALLLVCEGIDRMAIASLETALELDQMDQHNEARTFVLSIENNFRKLIKDGLNLE
jgi:hypothetical protein